MSLFHFGVVGVWCREKSGCYLVPALGLTLAAGLWRVAARWYSLALLTHNPRTQRLASWGHSGWRGFALSAYWAATMAGSGPVSGTFYGAASIGRPVTRCWA